MSYSCGYSDWDSSFSSHENYSNNPAKPSALPAWIPALIDVMTNSFRILLGMPVEPLKEKFLELSSERRPLVDFKPVDGGGTFGDRGECPTQKQSSHEGRSRFFGFLCAALLLLVAFHSFSTVQQKRKIPQLIDSYVAKVTARKPSWLRNSTCAADGFGLSCASICKTSGMGICNAQHLHAVRSEELMAAIAEGMGISCNEFHDHHVVQGSWDGPWIMGGLCGYSTSKHWKASCDDRPHCGYMRICPCVVGNAAEFLSSSSVDAEVEPVPLNKLQASTFKIPYVSENDIALAQNPQTHWTVNDFCSPDGRGLSCDEVCSEFPTGERTDMLESLKKEQTKEGVSSGISEKRAVGRCIVDAFHGLVVEEAVAKAASLAGKTCNEFHDHHAIPGHWDGPWVLGNLCGYSSSASWLPDCTFRPHCGYNRLCPCGLV